MKKIILMLSLFLAFSLAGCGTDDSEKATSVSETENSISETTSVSVSDESIVSENKAVKSEKLSEKQNNKPRVQSISCNINDSTKPEVITAEIKALCTENIRENVSFENLYNKNVLHSGVVGLVGAPLEISYNTETVKFPRLTLYYDKNELRGVPEDNLIILHYDEENACYNEIGGRNLNINNSSITVEIYEPGVYMLADIYYWYNEWGQMFPNNAYEKDKSQYISDWERECDTGDIMKIADTEWAMENAPYFNVSTPEQLAGAVYYVNAISGNGEEVYITLENDIDLADYNWKPMGWGGASNNHFSGIIDGQGHTISNLCISGEYRTAFIGYGLRTQVYDINFSNARINGDSYTGIVGGEIYMSDNWHDINVSGEVYAFGNDDYGTIIGRATEMTFNNCNYDDVLVNGEYFGYPSYLEKRKAETVVEEVFTLTLNDDGSISRNHIEGYQNIGWYIMQDDELLLHRNAENETTLESKYVWGNTVYLTAYINGAYIRVSNIIELN